MSVYGFLNIFTKAYPPVVVETTVQFGVAGEASLSKSRATHATLEAALVVGHVHDPHDVAIADRAAAHAAQGHRHFTATTIFGHHQGLAENKKKLHKLLAGTFHELSQSAVKQSQIRVKTSRRTAQA
jgi:hypothetical protein